MLGPCSAVQEGDLWHSTESALALLHSEAGSMLFVLIFFPFFLNTFLKEEIP